MKSELVIKAARYAERARVILERMQRTRGFEIEKSDINDLVGAMTYDIALMLNGQSDDLEQLDRMYEEEVAQ